jgi:hypothetical protein
MAMATRRPAAALSAATETSLSPGCLSRLSATRPAPRRGKDATQRCNWHMHLGDKPPALSRRRPRHGLTNRDRPPTPGSSDNTRAMYVKRVKRQSHRINIDTISASADRLNNAPALRGRPTWERLLPTSLKSATVCLSPESQTSTTATVNLRRASYPVRVRDSLISSP